MGISLTVCSPIHGSGKTVFTILLACRLSQLLNKNINILACCACMSGGGIMDMIGAEADHPSMEDLVNAGISASNKCIQIKGIIYRTGNLYFADSSKATPLYVQKNAAGYMDLFRYLKQEFDLIIIDTTSDPENIFSHIATESSDHVLTVMPQDIQALVKYQYFTQKALVHIINRYADIYPGRKEFASLFGMTNLFTLPNCSQLQEMKNKQQLHQYATLDTEYMKSIGEVAVFLSKVLHLPMAEKKVNKGLRHLFSKGGKQ